MKEKEVVKEEAKSRLWLTYLAVGVLIVFIIILLVLLLFVLTKPSDLLACGDGTLYGGCSLNEPYYCDNGTLIKNVSGCDCPPLLIKEGENCVSRYQKDPKEIKLRYFLRGEEKEIGFVAYKNMMEYLFSLPAFISYSGAEVANEGDFKLRNVNEKEQRELLIPLVIAIQNLDEDRVEQARIAISLVQGIPYGESEKNFSFFDNNVNYSRYPYDVLYDVEGICGEKSELLAFLLKEIGYGVAFLFYIPEDHEALAIKCPVKYSFDNSGYCFIETTGPAIIGDDEIVYTGGIRLESSPEIIATIEGKSLPPNIYEYDDAEDFKKLRRKMDEKGSLNTFDYFKWNDLTAKYNVGGEYNLA